MLIDSFDTLQKHARRMGVFHGVAEAATWHAVFRHITLTVVVSVNSIVDVVRFTGGFGLAWRPATVFTRLLGEFFELLFCEGKAKPSFLGLHFVHGKQLVECGHSRSFSEMAMPHSDGALVTAFCPTFSKISPGSFFHFSTRTLAQPPGPSCISADSRVRTPLNDCKLAKLLSDHFNDSHAYIIQRSSHHPFCRGRTEGIGGCDNGKAQ